MLLRAGANPNAANDLGIQPLSLACANGNLPMVRLLLAAGANASAAASTGESVLMNAVRSGNAEVVKALLEKGADVQAREKARQQTALMWAVSRQYPSIVRLLIEHGADVHARSRVVKEYVIRQRGAGMRRPTETVESGGSTPLLFAARLGTIDSARILIDAGANVNDTVADGTSALVMAAYSGHEEFATFLLEKGADPNLAGAGYSALHIAVLTGEVDLLKALLARGANPNAPLTKGTPVTRFGSEQVIQQALVGATPLHLAAKFSEPEMMRLLLAAGSDPKLTMLDGTTLLMAAASPESRTKVRRRSNNFNPEKQALESARIALDHTSDRNAKNLAGETALQIAESRKLPSVVQLLSSTAPAARVEKR